MDAPEYPSVYFGEDDIDELADFDRHFKSRSEGSYSRSKEIKAAMQIHLIADEVMAEHGFDPGSRRAREALIRQVLYDHFREE